MIVNLTLVMWKVEKSVGECSNSYYRSIGKTLIDAGFFVFVFFSKVNKLSHKSQEFKGWLNVKILHQKLCHWHIKLKI